MFDFTAKKVPQGLAATEDNTFLDRLEGGPFLHVRGGISDSQGRLPELFMVRPTLTHAP